MAPLPTSRGRFPQLLQSLLLAGSAALGLFIWQGHQGLSLADEGFLWYGVQRVMIGEVPMRDFMSYDPGRYYLAAALMSPLSNGGIIALRVVETIVQVLGLFIGLVLLQRTMPRPSFMFLLVAAVTLAVWMFPRHKLFDITTSVALIGALSFLVQRPSSRRYFLTGVIVGLAAAFGRNHGFYGLVGSLFTLAYLALGPATGPGPVRSALAWGAGIVLGYLPVLVMFVMVPGFWGAFWDTVRLLFQYGRTNLPLPIPWPWSVPLSQFRLIDAARAMLEGLFFIGLIAYGVLCTIWVIRQRLRNRAVSPTLAASAFMAIPYAHLAYSRADTAHLAQGAFPFLIGCLVLLANLPERTKWTLGAVFCGASLLIALPMHPGWQCRMILPCVAADVSGSRLTIDPATAVDITTLRRLAEQFAPGTRSFIAVPLLPGAYAILGRKAPFWDIYPLFRRSQSFQQAEIQRIKAANPGFAVVFDYPVDGRDALRFRNTHPLIDAYIREHFEALAGYRQDPAFQVYRSRSLP